MCGLAGILATGDSGPRLLKEMATSLTHRGPDDEGSWWDQTSRVGLAHRRLAVVDLSPAGHQPMLSSDGRFVLAFNGEIYNHRAPRSALEEVTRLLRTCLSAHFYRVASIPLLWSRCAKRDPVDRLRRFRSGLKKLLSTKQLSQRMWRGILGLNTPRHI